MKNFKYIYKYIFFLFLFLQRSNTYNWLSDVIFGEFFKQSKNLNLTNMWNYFYKFNYNVNSFKLFLTNIRN